MGYSESVFSRRSYLRLGAGIAYAVYRFVVKPATEGEDDEFEDDFDDDFFDDDDFFEDDDEIEVEFIVEEPVEAPAEETEAE